MMERTFSPVTRSNWRCEVNLVVRGTNYCDKRARWMDRNSGYVLCGEHKKQVEKADE